MKIRDKGISVNAADPGIVDSDMITMHSWVDPLANLFFDPLSVHPEKERSERSIQRVRRIRITLQAKFSQNTAIPLSQLNGESLGKLYGCKTKPKNNSRY